MNAIREFVHAALPWAILGVAVAVATAGSRNRRNPGRITAGRACALEWGWEWRWSPR